MPNYLITGNPGTGKSTMTRAIGYRGYRAIDLDNYPELVRLEKNETGRPATWPKGRPVNWNIYSYNIQAGPFTRLLHEPGLKFIGGSATNIIQFFDRFDLSFVLMIDDIDELRARLELSRNEHPDRTDADINRFIDLYPERTANYIALGAIPVDNIQPVDKAVDFIIAETQKL